MNGLQDGEALATASQFEAHCFSQNPETAQNALDRLIDTGRNIGDAVFRSRFARKASVAAGMSIAAASTVLMAVPGSEPAMAENAWLRLKKIVTQYRPVYGLL